MNFIYKLTKVFFFDTYLIKKEINELKKELPITIDSTNQLIDVSIKEKNIFYTYKLTQINKEDDSNYNFYKFKRKVQDSLCENSNTLDLLKKDYIMEYTYVDKNHNEIIVVKTNKQSCGKSIYDLDILKEILEKENSLF